MKRIVVPVWKAVVWIKRKKVYKAVNTIKLIKAVNTRLTNSEWLLNIMHFKIYLFQLSF